MRRVYGRRRQRHARLALLIAITACGFLASRAAPDGGGGANGGADGGAGGVLAYLADDVPVLVEDLAAVTSTISVDETYCVTAVSIDLVVTHPHVGDLIVTLSHGGESVVLIDRPGYTGAGFGCAAANINITLDDDAVGGPIEEQCIDDLASPPAYVPDEPLSAFKGAAAEGAWTLEVQDAAADDTGSLISWTLHLGSGGETCPPLAEDVEATVPAGAVGSITLDGQATGDVVEYIITSLPEHGSLADPVTGAIGTVSHTLADGGNVVLYEPSPGYTGPDAFSYKVVADGEASAVAAVHITVGTPQPVYVFDLTSDPGWSTTGLWAWGTPAGNAGDPSGGFTGSTVYGYNLDGSYENNLEPQYLTSPPLDCIDLSLVELRFRRWLGVEQGQYDTAAVEVSVDGESWQEVWSNPAGAGATIVDAAWSEQMYDLSEIADGEPAVQLRWVMGPTDSSLNYAGWNLDDIEIHAVTASKTPACPADLVGGDGHVDVADLLAMLGFWGACGSCSADLTGDSNVDVADLLELLAHWGPCG